VAERGGKEIFKSIEQKEIEKKDLKNFPPRLIIPLFVVFNLSCRKRGKIYTMEEICSTPHYQSYCTIFFCHQVAFLFFIIWLSFAFF